MIRFLRVRPFASYFCKNCPCSSLDHAYGAHNRSCVQCGHSPLRHYNFLNRYVLNPIRQFGYVGASTWFATVRLNDAWMARIEAGVTAL